jgi:hypothetical protein
MKWEIHTVSDNLCGIQTQIRKLWELHGFLASTHVGDFGCEKEVGVRRDGRIGERTVMDFMELYVHERGDCVIVKSGWRVLLCLERFITAKERPPLVIEMLCRGVLMMPAGHSRGSAQAHRRRQGNHSL